jgi:two-component system sensor histidine kinase PilS (NtrC family)
MLQGELDLKGDHKHLMDIVLRETDRLNTIITEFLDYARPRSDQRELLALDAVVNETIELFKNSRIFQAGISIRCEVAPNMAVTGDPQRLRQVFWNLLINAAQATSDGGSIVISAAPGTDDRSDEVIICISDTGTGIPNEHLENIFDPFFTTKTDGTGLGLAIVYRIIEDLGGSIDVKSEPGKGTIFTIRLPFEEIREPAASNAGLLFPGR